MALVAVRCGFAKSQEAYDLAVQDLAGALSKAEELLAKQRWVCGNRFTYMDLRLFMTEEMSLLSERNHVFRDL